MRRRNLGKSIIAFLLVFVMVLSPLQGIFAEEENENEKHITFLGTSDMHSNIYGYSYENDKEDNIGAARVYTYIEEVRASNPNTILVDNGDTYQGQIISDAVYNKRPDEIHPVSKYLNYAKYDAFVLGNHEFNFGLDFVGKINNELNMPVLAANASYKENGEPLVENYALLNFDGVKVGILGLTNPNAPRWDGDKVEPIKFESVIDSAKKYVPILKNEENCDIVIVSTHIGLNAEYGEDSGKALMNEVDGIDAVMLGHAHFATSGEENGVIYGMPKNLASNIVRFDFTLKENEEGKYEVIDKKSDIIETDKYEPSKEIRNLIKNEHNTTIDFIKNSIFGKASADFQPPNEIKGIPQGKLEDTAVIELIGNVQLEMSGADVTSVALFKDTSDIKKGDINYGSLFDIYKFDNTLYTVDVTGKELKDYMEWSVEHYNKLEDGDITVSFNSKIPGYRYDMFKGVDYEIDLSEDVGNRIKNIKFKGQPLKDDQILKLAVNNYRYSSGLKANNLVKDEKNWESPQAIRENIGEYIERKGTISPEISNNWKIVNDLSHPLRNSLIKLVNMNAFGEEFTKSLYNKSLNIHDLEDKGIIVDGKLADKYQEMIDGDIDNKESIKFTILHTNDVHGRAEEDPDKKVIGYAKYASIIKEFRENGPTLVLDAGDATHGTNFANLEDGISMIKLMNMAGIDAMTLGNHEFNYGIDGVNNLEKEANFPLMASNMYKVEDNSYPYNNYKIFDLNGLKVGVFGLATPETKIKSDPRNTEGYEFADSLETAENMISELKKEGAEFIVLLSHLGMDAPNKDNGNLNTYLLLDKVKGIDLVVDGHSHTKLDKEKVYNGTPIVSTGSFLNNIGICEIEYNPVTKEVSVNGKLMGYEEANKYEEDKEIISYINEVNKKHKKLQEIVGNSATYLDGEREHVRTGETNLANLITDTMLEVSNADVVITNGGGIRASIDKGEITYGDVFEVLPFGNMITLIEVTGQDILDALAYGAKVYPETNGGFPQVAGMSYIIIANDDNPETPTEIKHVLINGKEIDPKKTYKLATNDFMAVGGDGYEMFKGKKILGDFGSMLDAVVEKIEELSKDGSFTYKTDGRIKVMNSKEYKEFLTSLENNDNKKPNKNKGKAPKTGDEFPISYISIVLIASLGLVYLTREKNKNKEKIEK